jgi:prepilin-type N-terminal cleavage/methylation domain-containing protein
MPAAIPVETMVMRKTWEAGFSLMELMVVILVSGMLLAMTIPAIKSFTDSNNLKSATRSIRDQLMLAHDKAISTGQTQTIRFMKDFQGTSDYHIWNGTSADPSWKLPKGVTYSWDTGTLDTYHMTSNGQCQETGMIIIKNDKGDRDTISVRLSGLVLAY